MALTYVGGTIGTGTSTGYTVSLNGTLTGGSNSSPSAGDIVVVFAAHGGTAQSAPTVTGNSNGAYTGAGAAVWANDTWDCNFRAFYKIQGSTIDTSIAIARTTSTVYGGATAVQVWRGIDTTNPLDATGTPASGINSGMFQPPSITPTTSGAILIYGGAGTQPASTGVVPADTNSSTYYVAVNGDGSSSDTGVGMGAKAWTSGVFVATANTNIPKSNSASWCAQAIALRPLADPLIAFNIANSQYKADAVSVIPIGESTYKEGYATKIYQEQLIYTNYPNLAVVPKLENQQIGTSFANTATTTGVSMHLKSNDLPTWRRGAVLTYDSLNKRYITCGGYNGSVRFSDLWALTYDKDNFQARWRKLAPSGTPPPGKNLGAAVQLNKNGKSWFVYWGGSTGSDVQDMLIADCTTVNAETWTTVTQTNTPAIRSYITHHMVEVSTGVNTYDVYLFGGWGNTRLNDLMKCSFDLSGSVPTVITWTTVKANGAVGSPTIRSGTVMVYDSLNNRLVLFGGYTGSAYLADLWSFNIATSTWTQLSPTGTAPAGRELPNGAYDVVNQRMVVFSGWAGALTSSMNDIISINLVSGSESFTTIRANDLTNSGFAPFSSGAACLDYDKRLIVEFGQNGYDGTDKYVYAFDLDEGRVSDATMYGLNVVNTFMARDAPSYCVDTARNCGMLICGFSTMNDNTTVATGDHMNEVWSYDPTENRLRYLNSGSLGIGFREGAMACYDSVSDRILVFGGLTLTSRVCNELWELKPDTYGNYKARRMLPTGDLPDSRWLGVIAFDAVRNRVVVWGGASDNNVLLANDSMFILNLSSGDDGVWSKATPTGTPHGANWHPMFSYKASNNRLYIYSGASNSASSVFYTDTCYIDLTNANPAWVSLPSTTSTVGVWGGTMAYDAINNYLVAFGGGLSGSVVNTLSFLNLASDTNSWVTVVAKGITPAARRSTASWFINGKFYVTSGRPSTGMWFSDVQELTPNYATPTNSSWSNKMPLDYQPVQTATSGLVDNSNYHWQSWATVDGFDTTKSSFGGNLESVADFVVGYSGGLTGVKVWDGASWVYKPVKVWTGSGWIQKPVKVWTGSGWIQKA